MSPPRTTWTPWGDVPATDPNVIHFPRANLPRDPIERRPNGLAAIMAEITRQEMVAAAQRHVELMAERDSILRDEAEAEQGAAWFWALAMIFAVFSAATLGVIVGRWAMEAALGWGVW